MDDQNKNLLLATGLSFAVMLAWFAISPPQGPPPPVAVTTPIAEDAIAVDLTTNLSGLADADRITIDTPRLTGSLSLFGGRIDELSLKDYTETTKEGSPIVTLLKPEYEENGYYTLNGWAAASGVKTEDVPNKTTVWSSTAIGLTPNNPVTLTWNNGKGLLFKRIISVDEKYMFTIEQIVENIDAPTASLTPYGSIVRHGKPKDLKGFFILHEGAIRMADDLQEWEKYDDIRDYPILPKEQLPGLREEPQESGWIGFTDHFWMTVIVPENPFKLVTMFHPGSDTYQTDAYQVNKTVKKGETISVKSQFFAGAKEWDLIREYQNEGGIDRFLETIDWGWPTTKFLAKPIFWLLFTLNSYIGNMGWSIICLTLIIKALLLPLAYKSYVSMARMKELQPEMEKLKESAGDDKQKMQKGMMELYKKNKVNPAAGCLPILPQIPIFFALYKVIFVTIEVRHATWFGPFNDLSAPDPTSIIELFGLIPWLSEPLMWPLNLILIGILPLLLGISMFMQQKLNPAPTDATQKMIFAWMPWVFMFMLGSFPSALVVYWIANNTITFIQQYLIMRSQGVKPEVFSNLKDTFGKFKKGG